MTDSAAASPKITQELIGSAIRQAVTLVAPHLVRGERTLMYILSQSDRIGHFGLETQILRSLYEDQYDRIIVVTHLMSAPGTNPWIRACAGPKFTFVEVDSLDIQLLGQIDAPTLRVVDMDILLAKPRTIITRFYQHILAGGAIKSLTLSEEVEEIARGILSERGVDPDEPFVFFHNRTLQYMSAAAYHAYRTAEIETYKPALARLLDAGYRVIRLGEPGLDTMGFPADRYVNVPDWGGVDRAVDLFVLARNAFGFAQNSGPIWVSAAFGRPVLRTNTPYEHLNFPYNDDLSLFKHVRRTGSSAYLTYRETLDAGIAAMLQSEEIAAAGFEVDGNTPEELLESAEEMLSRIAGNWQRDDARDAQFQAIGAEYEARLKADPEMKRKTLDFYGYAHGYGALCRAQLTGNPHFLD